MKKYIALLYILMRDYLPTGTVAKIINELSNNEDDYQYTNKQLASYAEELYNRLK